MSSVEPVLGNGDVITASEKENSDVFHGASGTVGSLEIATLLEIQLMQAKKYVKATYHSTRSIPEAIEKTKAATQNPQTRIRGRHPLLQRTWRRHYRLFDRRYSRLRIRTKGLAMQMTLGIIYM